MPGVQSAVDEFESLLTQAFPYFKSSVSNQYAKFGDPWKAEFGEFLIRTFGQDGDRLKNAISGYAAFAVEGARLQKRFAKDRRYIPKGHQQAMGEVYMNEEYMLSLYLPGILLSHYLWPHHYRQLQFFRRTVLKAIQEASNKTFYDVGIGTGFYSRVILTSDEHARGRGFDISPFSIAFAKSQLTAFDVQQRYEFEMRDMMEARMSDKAPFIVSVEVLEHLEDPVSFLKGLRRMLEPGGLGYVTAAITAPNEDHIYLYNDAQDVIAHLQGSGFEVVDYVDERAYEPKAGEPVPCIGAFVVR